MRWSILLLFVLAPLPARATFHLISISEVFAEGGAQYVELQMYSPIEPQNLVAGHTVIFYNAAGTEVGRLTCPNNVASGANQSSILFATSSAATSFGVTPDFVLPVALMNPGGGKVCWETFDCFAWGAYTGSALGVGTPFGVLQPGLAAHRRFDIA